MLSLSASNSAGVERRSRYGQRLQSRIFPVTLAGAVVLLASGANVTLAAAGQYIPARIGGVAGAASGVTPSYSRFRQSGVDAFGSGQSGSLRGLLLDVRMTDADAEAQGLQSIEQPFQSAEPSGPMRPFHKASPVSAGTYRTLCVRSCDGYYFPISFATVSSRFKVDAAACQSMYPPGQAALYVHHTVGEDATQAISLTGEPLARQSFAFAYRSVYNASCAALLHPGSAAVVSAIQPPPASPVSAESVSLRGPGLLSPADAAPGPAGAASTRDMPGALDAVAGSTEPVNPDREAPRDVRVVGPAYLEPSELGDAGRPRSPAQDPAPAMPVISPDTPPVAASILPNPLNFLR